MVTTRSAEKSAAPVSTTASAPTSTSHGTKPAKLANTAQAGPHKAELPPSERQEGIHAAAAPRRATGKRKRAGGDSREPPNVGPGKKQRPDESDDVTVEDNTCPSFDSVTLQKFVAHIDSRAKCARCRSGLRPSLDLRSHVESRSPLPADSSGRDWESPSTAMFVLSAAHCPSSYCAGITCIGCTKDLSPSMSPDGHNHAIYGCEYGWYVALWIQLAYAAATRAMGAFPSGDASPRRSSSKSATSKTSKHSHHSSAPAGTGYASGTPGMDHVKDSKPRFQPAEAEKLVDKHDEALLTAVANLIRAQPSAATAPDAARNVTPVATATTTSRRSKSSRKSQATPKASESPFNDKVLLPTMFHWSGVLHTLSRLFRNDSLEDAFSRREVYDAAVGLVDALLANDNTSRLVLEQTYDAVKATRAGTESISSAFPTFDTIDHNIESASNQDVEGASVADVMENILVACETLSNAAASMPKVYKDKTSREMLSFAERMQETGERLGKLAPKVRTAGTTLPQGTSSCERFEMVDEADITKLFMRSKDIAKGSGGGTSTRMRALHREIGMLRTSLPYGIWVKMASTRPDIVKALIIGPEGTPYEGGLFEFDLLCPKNYPNAPPKVDCATCAREEARQFSLNPNLYNNGYVCLSVINTWHGAKQEQWLPGKSTILQVLISIQSMVLGTATPADNEPGGLGMPHEAYNRTVQPGTIKAALLPWLQSDELRKGVWAAEVEAYFKANATQVLKTTKDWAKDNKRITEFSASPFAHLPPPPEGWAVSPEDPAPPSAEPQATGGSNPNGAVAPGGPNTDSTPTLTTVGVPSGSAGAGAPHADSSPEMEDLHSFLPPNIPFPPLPPHLEQFNPGLAESWYRRAGERKVKTVNLLEELEKALKEYL